MKVVDANVLLYAVNSDARHHEPATRWLTSALAGAETTGLPWISLLAFVRVGTHPQILPRPLSATDAFDLVDSWLAQPAAIVVEPTTRHSSILRGLLEQAGTAGNLTTDAHLAALAIEHGAQVATFDRDVARFGVKVCLPG